MKLKEYFPFTKSYLHHEVTRGCKETGIKRIAITDRMGHECIHITYNYAHLFPLR